MIRKNNPFLFFSLKEIYPQLGRNRLTSNGFSKVHDTIFFKNKTQKMITIKTLPLLDRIDNSFKYIYNIKNIFMRYFDYIFERSMFSLKTHNLLYSCKYKSKKNINMLKKYSSRKRLTNTLFNSVFFSGLGLDKLFYTKIFLKNNIKLHNSIFIKNYYRSFSLNKLLNSINKFILMRYLYKSYKKNKKLYSFFNNSKKCRNWI